MAGALEARGIGTENNLVADVEAKIRGDEKMFLVDSVHLRYRLKIPAGRRPEADRSFEIHERYCPVHQSITRGFPVTWSVDIEEG